jgi:hypothetical protein
VYPLTGNPKMHILLELAVLANRARPDTGAHRRPRGVTTGAQSLLVSHGVGPQASLLAACRARQPRLCVYAVRDACGCGDSIQQCFLSAEQVARSVAEALGG